MAKCDKLITTFEQYIDYYNNTGFCSGETVYFMEARDDLLTSITVLSIRNLEYSMGTHNVKEITHLLSRGFFITESLMAKDLDKEKLFYARLSSSDKHITLRLWAELYYPSTSIR